jgi:hypothetical protein
MLSVHEHSQIQQSKNPESSPQRRSILTNQTHISSPADIIQRARINPKSLASADVLQLQRTIGNRAVRKLFTEIGLIPFKSKQEHPIQVQTISEEEKKLFQGKMAETVQCKETPEEGELLQENFKSRSEQEKFPSCSAVPIQMEIENHTGMPDNLKAGVEGLSGIDMSDVRVHYNSDKPTGVGALAYTQGVDIHVAPGQEKHLPHEAWHVVQQKQERVQPTMQLKNVAVNDDVELEWEADEMGRKADNIKIDMGRKNMNSSASVIGKISTSQEASQLQPTFCMTPDYQLLAKKIKPLGKRQKVMLRGNIMQRHLIIKDPPREYRKSYVFLDLTKLSLMLHFGATDEDIQTLQYKIDSDETFSYNTWQDAVNEAKAEVKQQELPMKRQRQQDYEGGKVATSSQAAASQAILRIIEQKMMEVNKLKINRDAGNFRDIAGYLNNGANITISIIVGMKKPKDEMYEQTYEIEKYVGFAGVKDADEVLSLAIKKRYVAQNEYKLVYEKDVLDYARTHPYVHAEERVIIHIKGSHYVLYGYSTTNVCKKHHGRSGCKDVIKEAKSRLSGKKEGQGIESYTSRREFKLYLPGDIVDWFLFNYRLEKKVDQQPETYGKEKGSTLLQNMTDIQNVLQTKFPYEGEQKLYTSILIEALSQINRLSQFGSHVWTSRRSSRHQNKDDMKEWFLFNYKPVSTTIKQNIAENGVQLNEVIGLKNIVPMLVNESGSEELRNGDLIRNFMKYIKASSKESQMWVRVGKTPFKGGTLEEMIEWFSGDYEPISSTTDILSTKYLNYQISAVYQELDGISKFWKRKVGKFDVSQQQTQPLIPSTEQDKSK